MKSLEMKEACTCSQDLEQRWESILILPAQACCGESSILRNVPRPAGCKGGHSLETTFDKRPFQGSTVGVTRSARRYVAQGTRGSACIAPSAHAGCWCIVEVPGAASWRKAADNTANSGVSYEYHPPCLVRQAPSTTLRTDA